MYDEKAIYDNIEVLRNFCNNYRKDRDAKPTEEENLKSKLRVV